MVKKLDGPPSILLSSRTVPPELGAGKGYSQKGTYQEKLPEWIQVRTKTIHFRRRARLKKTKHNYTTEQENCFPSVQIQLGSEKHDFAYIL